MNLFSPPTENIQNAIESITKYMETQNKTAEFEKVFYDDLHQYLVSINCIDDHFPEAPDIEACWAKIGESYMPDGLREFNKYPIVSLGWPMFIGMSIAKYWDEDWALYSKVENLYHYLRDRIDFDHMDDYVCDKVLLLDANAKKKVQELVGECASRTLNKLLHLGVAPGSKEAFLAFIAALHELYLMGAAMQLKTMGYHMTKME